MLLDAEQIALEAKAIESALTDSIMSPSLSRQKKTDKKKPVKTNDNVIILGAGFSAEAGIPLLTGFVEQMWELAARKSHNGKPLSDDDLKIFEEAAKVKKELDSYHARAVFDDRNIEDILSILSLNVAAGAKADKDNLSRINRAIVRTIELTCSIGSEGLSDDCRLAPTLSGPELYRDFWRYYFNWAEESGQYPTIITFNYDLVLERSLFQVLNSARYYDYKKRPPFKSFEINYFHDKVPEQKYVVAYKYFLDSILEPLPGTILKPLYAEPMSKHAQFEILKLHGSLNFPKPRVKLDPETYNFLECLDDPYLTAPISAGMTGNNADRMWTIAWQRLREAKNIVIVGYGLPTADNYLHYFLKSALGPNMDLNQISVFDSALYEMSAQSLEIRKRYQACFAPQLHNRIQFSFEPMQKEQHKVPGGAAQFVEILGKNPGRILF